MRPRTFAREIAFQVLYRDDLNPDSRGRSPSGDALLDQGRQTRELMEFVRHLAELCDQEDAMPPTKANSSRNGCARRRWSSSPGRSSRAWRPRAGLGPEDRRRGRELARRAHGRHRPQPLAAGGLRDPFTDTPGKVAIDETVELAKRFGGAQSAQFVNGILDNLMHQKKNTKRKSK